MQHVLQRHCLFASRFEPKRFGRTATKGGKSCVKCCLSGCGKRGHGRIGAKLSVPSLRAFGPSTLTCKHRPRHLSSFKFSRRAERHSPKPQTQSFLLCAWAPHAPNAPATGWLGREDSNLRMAESKSAALPLGYAPTHRRDCSRQRVDGRGNIATQLLRINVRRNSAAIDGGANFYNVSRSRPSRCVPRYEPAEEKCPSQSS
jgi:hypothetical protein